MSGRTAVLSTTVGALPTAAWHAGAWVAALVPVAVAAAAVELLALRVLLRLGPVLPSRDWVQPVARVVQVGGIAALNLAALAAGLALALIALGLLRRPRSAAVGVLLLLAAASEASLGLMIAATHGPWPTIVRAGVGVPAALAAIASAAARPREWPLLAAVGATQVLLLAHSFAQGLAMLGLSLPAAAGTFYAAEALAVAAALLLPASAGARPNRRQVLAGAVPAALFLGMHTAAPWMAATISIWTTGFSLFLPGWLYAVALACAIAGMLALRGRATGHPRLEGLLLIGLAGLQPGSSYAHLLGLLGLVLVAGVAADVPPYTGFDADGARRVRSRARA